MTNTNCLKDIRCPSCGFENEFEIFCTAFIEVSDNGLGELQGAEWEQDSYIRCLDCGMEATVKDFTLPS